MIKEIVFAVSIYIVLSTAALGQPADYYLNQMHRAAQRTLVRAVADIRVVLDPASVTVLDNVAIIVDRRQRQIYEVSAQRDLDGRRIVISLGFIDAVYWAASAVVVANLTETEINRVLDYVENLAEYMYDSRRRTTRGESPTGFPSFGAYIGMTEKAWVDLIDDDVFQAQLDAVMQGSLAFVIAHEIAHHLLGHLENDSSTIGEELEADRYAANVVNKAGYYPLLATIPFLVFSALEGDSAGIYEPGRVHPPAMCRFVDVIRAGVAANAANADFLSYLRQNGQYDAYMGKVETLETGAAMAIEEHQLDCP